MITDLIELPPDERMKYLIGYAFGGTHRVGPIKKIGEGTRYIHWRFSVVDGMTSHDDDRLTRLVIASLAYGIRVELIQSGPGRIGVLLHPRNARTGSFCERIDTPEQAVANFNGVGKLEYLNNRDKEER